MVICVFIGLAYLMMGEISMYQQEGLKDIRFEKTVVFIGTNKGTEPWS